MWVFGDEFFCPPRRRGDDWIQYIMQGKFLLFCLEGREGECEIGDTHGISTMSAPTSRALKEH